MTIQTFIEKAEAGGWEDHYDARGCERYPIEHVVLDPEAWKAVGRAERTWNMLSEKHWGQEEPMPEWQWKMHRMIDALAEGKSIEQYLETL
jgi:hypothetical protein